MRSMSVALVMLLVTPAFAQDFPNPQPGDAHEILARDAGTWDCTLRMYLQGPDGEPTEYKGTEVNRLVSGDLYLRTRFTAKMGDRKFEGHGLMGYDPRSEKYTGTWVDNFSVIPSRFSGTYDAESKTLTIYNTVVHDESGAEFKQKQVTVWEDDSHKEFTIYLVVESDGKTQDVKLMEMTAVKKPKAKKTKSVEE
ncbi:hypothetical protein Mal4_11540 [Maioricimonas rarisocia]|uniref:DUF1579 domain-containing protein n=1 Tax=Maioricimonas rarisocia TaxID=2528026 RepID=A0A517Z2X9_9PLAN|nr:DUF1579 family protein [Maioricimonas rarisocia]QDU36854.1 hypothetical protein Mal4_11540 [Maioricimonas rarisocia]